MYQKVILVGNLGKDPETVATDKAKIIKFPLATNESWKNSAGVWEQKATWHNVVMFTKYDGQGDNLSKGAKVFVEGKISNSSYEDKDGVTRYKSEIVAQRVSILSSDEITKTETVASNEVIDLPF